jgi:branched-subunit amino acid aminotransferase/4-amino-4-deoxychorismate lyase
LSLAGRARAGALPERAVWIDGAVLRGSDAALSVFDRGARDGEGLFETLRVYGGLPFRWERHLERLVISAAELGFPVPPSPATLREAVALVLDANQLSDAAIRITVTRGVPSAGRGRRTRAGAWVEAEALGARLWPGTRSGGARVVLSKRPFAPGPLARHKTTSRLAYHLAREEARAARADEALLVSPEGLVLEGSVSNLFAVVEGSVRTPPVALGILPGIAREVLIAVGSSVGIPIEEGPVPADTIGAAEELFLTNSIQEVVPVSSVDGRAMAPSSVGMSLLTAYRDEVDRMRTSAVAKRERESAHRAR